MNTSILISKEDDIVEMEFQNKLGRISSIDFSNMPTLTTIDAITDIFKINGIEDVPLILLTAYTDRNPLQPSKPVVPSTSPPAVQIGHLDKATHLVQHLLVKQTENSIATPLIEKRVEQDAPLRFKDAVFIKQNYRYNKIKYQDILYLKADGNYICIYTTGKTYMVKHSLQAFITQFLNNEGFIRIHRSFAVNTEHICSFSDTTATIIEKEIPIGPNYRADFMKLFVG